LAGTAALAGALAPFAGSPYHRPARGVDRSPRLASGGSGSIDVAELARVVADQEDHVSAVELASWIRARRPGLRVIDVRSASEFRAFHIPGAEHIPLEALPHARFAAGDTVVLYSEVGVHGAQAWVFLRALGHRQVFFLREGLHEWLDDVMSPTLAADAPPEAQAAFAAVAELSRWFGGTPRRLTETALAPAAAPVAARRRGC
jgi:rhodanese-related sulfurtransferase